MRQMYVNCTIGEDPEGNTIIYSIHNISQKPKYKIVKEEDVDTYFLQYEEKQKISIPVREVE